MKPRPIEVVDEGGRLLARVPLGRHNKYAPQLYAEIWKDDHEFLGKLGLSPNWNCYRVPGKGHFVTSSAVELPGHRVLVGRVLMDADSGYVVKYVDGNPLNLRRENLRLVPNKRAKLRSRSYVRSKQHCAA